MNKIILVGNLCNDPELSTTTTGVSVCKFNLAVQRSFSNSSGEKETDFFKIVVWREKGENAHKYLKKGNKAGVSGSVQIRSYEDKDGNKRYFTDIVADEVEFLTPKNTDFSPVVDNKDKGKESVKQVGLEPIDDKDLPF